MTSTCYMNSILQCFSHISELSNYFKTAKMNTNLPVYLQINGKQVDVIGGEGIMLTQPLSEDFAND